ncbi:hypothetical protein EC973_000489 [Apophysomyces ossiformis]|uniref:Protein MEMO1 n=1 Tax=Apophysomyces ossiformis TaxID=679940 RepID=A0A8H7BR79_9FUNG|nr:hypothetical protein EC973_000489 [Apophysomyces ossiformis]
MRRSASHAGSWYTSSRAALNQQLDRDLAAVPSTTEDEEPYPIPGVRAIIGPYVLATFAKRKSPNKENELTECKRVFLLGPSHHVYLNGCALSQCDTYETPLGDLTLDRSVIEELYATGHFVWMNKDVDEDEHSIEMHLPYTYKIFSEKIDQITVVPILVGSIRADKEELYGKILSKYLEDPANLFIISSDFCHWGSRFQYTFYRKERTGTPLQLGRNMTSLETPIHASIRDLDYEGMETIESLDFEQFALYLARTRNTICGRHPISVLLAAMTTLREEKNQTRQRIKFVKYAQSSACENPRDSSVSYASAFVCLE